MYPTTSGKALAASGRRCACPYLPMWPMIRGVPRSRCLGVEPPAGQRYCHDPSSVRRHPASAGRPLASDSGLPGNLRTEARRGDRHRGARGTGWLRRPGSHELTVDLRACGADAHRSTGDVCPQRSSPARGAEGSNTGEIVERLGSSPPWRDTPSGLIFSRAPRCGRFARLSPAARSAAASRSLGAPGRW